MWMSNLSGIVFLCRSRRQVRDWLWWLTFFTYFFVPTVVITASFINLRTLLTPDGADALAVVTTLLTAVATLSFTSACITDMLAMLARWLRIEQHAVGKAIISAADALDISSSQGAARFTGWCRAAFRDMKNPAYSQLGAVGNLKAARSRSQNAIARRPAAQGRQAGAAPANRTKAGSKSADDDGDGGGDPEPPQERLYTYAEFAQLFRVACQTLRNKVSAGQFPAPVHTIFGPRFNQQHVDYAVNPPKKADSSSPRRRGRPRIAGSQGGGL
jgi:hypothetical protein